MPMACPPPRLGILEPMSFDPAAVTGVTFVTFVTFRKLAHVRQMAESCGSRPKLMKLITP